MNEEAKRGKKRKEKLFLSMTLLPRCPSKTFHG
jgi:hypothetical protein